MAAMLPWTAPEDFTDDERDLLRPHFTDLDGPVFALVNLPEVTKGALFARYSRSAKSLRRLFLDEFVAGGGSSPGGAPLPPFADPPPHAPPAGTAPGLLPPAPTSARVFPPAVAASL